MATYSLDQVFEVKVFSAGGGLTTGTPVEIYTVPANRTAFIVEAKGQSITGGMGKRENSIDGSGNRIQGSVIPVDATSTATNAILPDAIGSDLTQQDVSNRIMLEGESFAYVTSNANGSYRVTIWEFS
jgi:hypothetical protein